MPPNIFAMGQEAFANGYATQQKMREDRGRMAGGRALAAGDRQGAMTALGGAGLTDDVRQVQADQMVVDDRSERDRKSGIAEREHKGEQLLKAMDVLGQVPEAERIKALQHPVFQSILGPDAITQIKPEDLTDQALLIARGNVKRELEIVKGSDGSYSAVDKLTGQRVTGYQPPARPQYKTVGEGQSLVEIPGEEAPAAAPDEGDWLAGVSQAAPDAQVTSGLRTPARNAQVGGKANSRHLSGQAVDLVPRPGESMAQLYARVRGVPGVRAINEGDHVHVQTGGAKVAGGARVIAQGAPKPMDRWEDLPGGGQVNTKTGEKKNVPGGPGSRKDFAQLRKEFNALDEVKNFKDVRSSYLQVRALASKPKPTPADDTALTFSFMKMLDPGSVVREGEFALVGRSAGLPDQIVMQLAKVDQGKGLTPTIRARLVETAAQVLLQRRSVYDQQSETYRQIAGDMGANPDQLVEDPTAWKRRDAQKKKAAPKPASGASSGAGWKVVKVHG